MSSAPKSDSSPKTKAKRRGGANVIVRGEPLRWLMGSSLTLCVLMIVGLIGLIVFQGASTFWPKPIVEVELTGGAKLMGAVSRSERFTPDESLLTTLEESEAERLLNAMAASEDGTLGRFLLRHRELRHRQRSLRVGG